MLNNATVNKLHAMKLNEMAKCFIAIQENPEQYSGLGFPELIGIMVDAQYNKRTSNKLGRLINNAELELPNACLTDINYTSGRTLDQNLIRQLGTCEYIALKNDVIITGATGSGKTYLACALGIEALRQFVSVKYVCMADMLLECSIAWENKEYEKALRDYAKPKLLIIDEWLARNPDPNEINTIKQIVKARSKIGATIFCSQIRKEGWYQALGADTKAAESIVDQIVFNSYEINIEYSDPAKAVSMRKIYSNLKPLV